MEDVLELLALGISGVRVADLVIRGQPVFPSGQALADRIDVLPRRGPERVILASGLVGQLGLDLRQGRPPPLPGDLDIPGLQRSHDVPLADHGHQSLGHRDADVPTLPPFLEV